MAKGHKKLEAVTLGMVKSVTQSMVYCIYKQMRKLF